MISVHGNFFQLNKTGTYVYAVECQGWRCELCCQESTGLGVDSEGKFFLGSPGDYGVLRNINPANQSPFLPPSFLSPSPSLGQGVQTRLALNSQTILPLPPERWDQRRAPSFLRVKGCSEFLAHFYFIQAIPKKPRLEDLWSSNPGLGCLERSCP